jgi:hypothetical protein
MTPSCRFPLRAGGTAMCAARFPSRSGGNLKEGGNQELWLRDWYNKKEGKHNLPPSLSWLDAQCLTDRRPLQALQASRRCCLRSFHRRLRRPFQA